MHQYSPIRRTSQQKNIPDPKREVIRLDMLIKDRPYGVDHAHHILRQQEAAGIMSIHYMDDHIAEVTLCPQYAAFFASLDYEGERDDRTQ